MGKYIAIAIATTLTLAACAHTSSTPPIPAKKMLVIGHRGAAGYRPEHTQASYELATELGADYIEPDLVMTKDHVLIARHENNLSDTTDVERKFPERKTTKTVDGVKITGWFAEDFTLKEIKTLRARERLPLRNHTYDGQFQILTFKEVIAIAQRRSRELGRTIGVYPETKHPSYFASIGMALEEPLLAELKTAGWDKPGSPVFIQSAELSSLQKIHRSNQLPLIFLMDDPNTRPYDYVINNDPRTYGDLTKPEELKKMAVLLYGIGPWKRLIVPETKDGKLLPHTSLIRDAHAAGLAVHPYTFRSDGEFLNAAYHGDPAAEYLQFCQLGVDAVFSDFADHAVAAFHRCTLAQE